MYQNSYISDEDDDDDDDWFFDSIQRYDDLLMYEFQGKVSSAAFLSAERLIASCLNTNKRHEILELAVPERLLAGKDAGLVKNRDFSVESAGYLKSNATCVLPYESILITSEDDGVNSYNIPNHCDSDLITFNSQIRKLINSQICLDSTNGLVSGSKINDIKIHSIETGKEARDFSSIPVSESLNKNQSISFLESRSNNLIVGCSDNGLLFYVDMRSNAIRFIDLKERTCKWAYSVSPNGKIGLVNSLGVLYLFDERNFSKESMKIENQFDSLHEESSLMIQFDLFNSFVSVSGFDKSVKIFSLDSKTENAIKFNHDGHKNCGYVNGHIWHSTLDNVVFSYDDTGALQAWKFK